jgi:hypothetical protein
LVLFCPRNVPDFSVVEDRELPSRLLHITGRHDVVALENRAGSMPADFHRNALPHAGPDEIPNATSPQIVEDEPLIHCLNLRLRILTVRLRLRVHDFADLHIRDWFHLAEPAPYTSSVPCLSESLNR